MTREWESSFNGFPSAYVGKELPPRPDSNFVGGAKRGEYHFHIANRDNTLWAHVKNQKTGREVSNFLLDIDVETLSEQIQECFSIVNPHSMPKVFGSRMVQAWDFLDFTKAMLQEMSYDDLERVLSISSEVPLRNLHTLVGPGVPLGLMMDLWRSRFLIGLCYLILVR